MSVTYSPRTEGSPPLFTTSAASSFDSFKIKLNEIAIQVSITRSAFDALSEMSQELPLSARTVEIDFKVRRLADSTVMTIKNSFFQNNLFPLAQAAFDRSPTLSHFSLEVKKESQGVTEERIFTLQQSAALEGTNLKLGDIDAAPIVNHLISTEILPKSVASAENEPSITLAIDYADRKLTLFQELFLYT